VLASFVIFVECDRQVHTPTGPSRDNFLNPLHGDDEASYGNAPAIGNRWFACESDVCFLF